MPIIKLFVINKLWAHPASAVSDCLRLCIHWICLNSLKSRAYFRNRPTRRPSGGDEFEKRDPQLDFNLSDTAVKLMHGPHHLVQTVLDPRHTAVERNEVPGIDESPRSDALHCSRS